MKGNITQHGKLAVNNHFGGKGSLDGDFSDAHRNYLSRNNIKYHDGEVLKKLQIVLFTQDKKSGEIASYFDDKRVCLDRYCQVPVKPNDLWICHVTMNTEKLGYATPLHRIKPGEILEMDGKMEQIAEFMWKNRPKEVIKHLDVSEDVSRLEVLTSDYEALTEECEILRLQAKETEGSLRAQIEEEFRESEEKLVNEHQTVLVRLNDEHDRKVASIEDVADNLRETVQRLTVELENKEDDEEIQKLKDSIAELSGENESLRIQISAEKDSMNQKVEELTARNRTLSDYYESKIESLENELVRSGKTSEPFFADDGNFEDREEMQDLLHDKDEEIVELKAKLKEMTGLNAQLGDRLEYAEKRMNTILQNSERTNVETKLIPMSGSVIRVSVDEFKCSLIDEGAYTVKINADRTILRFVPDAYGTAECRNGIIRVPDLDRIEVLGNRFGELKWKMVNGNTLEVSI